MATEEGSGTRECAVRDTTVPRENYKTPLLHDIQGKRQPLHTGSQHRRQKCAKSGSGSSRTSLAEASQQFVDGGSCRGGACNDAFGTKTTEFTGTPHAITAMITGTGRRKQRTLQLKRAPVAVHLHISTQHAPVMGRQDVERHHCRVGHRVVRDGGEEAHVHVVAQLELRVLRGEPAVVDDARPRRQSTELNTGVGQIEVHRPDADGGKHTPERWCTQ